MEDHITDPVRIIRDQVKQFDPHDLLSYITLLGTLPGNEDKYVQLDTIFRIIISTRQKKFKNSEFDPDDIIKLLDDMDSNFYCEPPIVSIPTSIFDYPQVWILGKRYHIFPGPRSLAYDYWQELVTDYFPIRKAFDVKGYDPINIIEDVLSLQSRLVSVIRKHRDSISEIRGTHIPSPELFESWKRAINEWYQHSPHKSFYDQHSVTLGRKINSNDLFDHDPIHTICQFFSISFAPKTAPIFQYDLLSFLSLVFLNDLKSLRKQNPLLLYDTFGALSRNLSKLFPSGDILPHFSVNDSKEVDFAVICDSDKIFLFKIIHADLIDDLQEHLAKSTGELKSIASSILIGRTNFKVSQRPVTLSSSVRYEPIPIILAKSIYFNAWSSYDIPDGVSMVLSLSDFLALSNELKDGMALLKFFRYWDENQANMSSLYGQLDAYVLSFYAESSLSLNTDNTGHMHVWYKYYLDKLKDTSSFQPRLDADEPVDLWDVNPVSDKIFRAHNPQTNQTAVAFHLTDERVIWMLSPKAISDYLKDELYTFDLLTQLVSYRFTQSDAFKMFLLKKCGINSDKQIRFMLYPDSFIQRQKLRHYYKFLPLLTSENPVLVKAKRVSGSGKHVFDVIYSANHLSKSFRNDSLYTQQIIIKLILSEISSQSAQLPPDKIEESLQEIFQDIPLKFNIAPMTSMPLSSLHALTHALSTKTLQYDADKASILVADWVRGRFNPGTYDGNAAKSIMRDVIDFLETSLIQKLQPYSIADLLSYVVRVDGSLIESKYIQQKIPLDNYVDVEGFDPTTLYHEEDSKISQLSFLVRFAIDFVIKANPQGDSPLTTEKWLEIQAMFYEFSIYVFGLTTIDYRSRNFELSIDDEYYIQWDSDGVLDDAYTHSQTFADEIFITSPTASMSTFNLNSLFNDLNPSFFDEFHISFQDFLKVLECCMSLSHDQLNHTITVSQSDLISHVQSIFTMEKHTVISGLKLASLVCEDLADLKYYFIDAMSMEFYYLIKPIPVFQKDDEKFYVINSLRVNNSKLSWFACLKHGHMPYLSPTCNPVNITSDKLEKTLQKMQKNIAMEHGIRISFIIMKRTPLCASDVKISWPFAVPDSIAENIDNFSVYPSLQKVVIIQAKPLYWNLSSQEKKSEIQKYTKDDGFIDKLLKTMEYVKEHLGVILEHYGLSPSTENWRVEGYFVTSSTPFPIPMPPGIQIIHIDDL